MTSSRPYALLVLFLCGVSYGAGVSLQDYRGQLHDIAEKVRSLQDHPEQAGNIIAAIPDETSVRTENGDVAINFHPLKDDLTEFSKAGANLKPEQLEQLESYVQRLEEGAAVFDHGQADASSSRQKIDEILARREFRNVHRPSMKETLLGKLYRRLARLLGRIHLQKGAFNVIQIMVYLLVGAALLLLVFWTLNRFRRKADEAPPREIIPFSPSAKSWRAWLGEARNSAEKQDWRNAIHLAYWAGISFLESGGAWKPNRARTPREYLRLLSTRNSNYPSLSALTRKFEIVWYGDRPAGQQDFQETLAQLEKLGCR